MENQVLITFEDNGKTFQLFKSEKNGKVDTDWLVETFGRGTC